MLRGNHECREMTTTHNFKKEVLYKYDQEVYQRILEVFDYLPLGAVVGNKFFTVHGGISPSLQLVKDINNIDRFREIPKKGLFCDLLWSDPIKKESGKIKNSFAHNSDRKCSYFYGKESTSKFLKKNNLLCLIRAHEVKFQGYEFHNWGK
jgi:serine/threonine-protein phosphatase 2B catalytic subunit